MVTTLKSIIHSILFYIYIQCTNAFVESINTPCITQVEAISDSMLLSKSMEKFSTHVTKEYCYSELPNRKSEIYGINISDDCYVYSKQRYIHLYNHTISRCGQCIEIIGPSLMPYKCMISGWFTYNGSDINDNILNNIILVNDIVAKKLVSEKEESGFQIAMSYSSCNYVVLPSLIVIRSNSTTLTILVYNTNERLYSISNGVWSNVIDKDGYFYIDPPINGFYERLVVSSIERRTIVFNKITSQTGKVYHPISQFSKVKENKNCCFIPSKIIFSNTINYSALNAGFKYLVSSFTIIKNLFINDKIEATQGVVSTQSISLLLNGKRNGIIIQYPTSIQVTKHFKETVIQINSSSLVVKEIYLAQLNLVSQNDSSNVHILLDLNENCKFFIEKAFSNQYNLRIGLNQTIKGFFNSLIIDFETNDSSIQITSAESIERNEKSMVGCTIDSFDCNYTECSVSNDRDCYQYCGSCMPGFHCTSSGFCEISTSIPSSSFSYVHFLVLFLILFVFI
ncbi:hypothetical protein ENUP19_0211G0010 [Entamoeba nuttalli]|uniref:Uncharacterized protein n=2 Tax=Entamoeba nuttalli TaxID=412467 RepID=K2HN26_ENTNP|nr:hypothetical protein ENU1_204960 [Entamoeba nuttalli P19]EKE37215.1 hypothetical protein ENU1_204960 [Entamoeba nuttalli P19]|eukprot:XP_008860447.1 hypothetical protein ENU1_204960 [Entamoeba nuttalli P19]